jgi:hypothetical protein
MTDTPKDIHLAIWELLTPEERRATKVRKEEISKKRTWDDIGATRLEVAHRAIVDAAREVLDLACVEINVEKCDPDWLWFYGGRPHDDSDPIYFTRTEAIYHALKWLRGQEQ